MRRPTVKLALLLALTLSACSRPGSKPPELIVAAAASLKDALAELQNRYQVVSPDVQVRFTYGSSGALQQQIEQGAPADLFLAAAPDPMDALVSKGLVDRAAVRTVATNTVVLVGPAGGPVTGWSDLDKAARIALGDPKSVPAGKYGKAVLEHVGLWSKVQTKLVLAEDVREVLHYVESGDVEAGIVYRTDAATSPKVTVIAEAPAGSHPPVIYPVAVIKGTKHPAEAQAFANWLLSPEAQSILKKHGFGGAG